MKKIKKGDLKKESSKIQVFGAAEIFEKKILNLRCCGFLIFFKNPRLMSCGDHLTNIGLERCGEI